MNNNHVLINCDTDSIMIAKPDGAPWSKEEQETFLKALNDQFPEQISWEHDGVYTSVLVIGSKNYALLPEGENKIKLKGSSIRDQKKEPALREMMEKIIHAMIYDKQDTIPGIYKEYVQEALNVKDITRWCQKKNVSRAVLDCEGWESKVIQVINKKGKTVNKTIYFSDHADDLRMNEIVIWEAIKHIEGIQEGDKLYLYPVIVGKKVITGRVSEKTGKPLKDSVEEVTGLRLKTEWKGEEDKLKLVERVYTTISIFSKVLDMDQFVDYSKSSNSKLLEELNEVLPKA